jgi:hypothetical protein
MRGVKSSAKADLNNRGGDLFLTERFKDCADEDLKLRRWPDPLLDLVGGIKGARNRLGEREWGEWLPVDLHPLAVADQVRLRGGGVANSRRLQCRRDESNDAPLPIRSCHERTANPGLGGAECAQKGV